jgi:hypothetical protein
MALALAQWLWLWLYELWCFTSTSLPHNLHLMNTPPLALSSVFNSFCFLHSGQMNHFFCNPSSSLMVSRPRFPLSVSYWLQNSVQYIHHLFISFNLLLYYAICIKMSIIKNSYLPSLWQIKPDYCRINPKLCYLLDITRLLKIHIAY